MHNHLTTIIFALAAVLAAGAQEWRLERSVVPVKVDAAIWDMSGGDELSRHEALTYKFYGDTLVRETAEGRRRWFERRGESTLFILEESRLATIRPTVAPATAALGDCRLCGDCDFEARGSYSRTFKLAEQGRYETREVRRGRLVVAQGDTLDGVRAIAERRCFTAKIAADEPVMPLDAVADSLDRYEIVTTRWFADGVTMPVAVQTEVTVSDTEGRNHDSHSRAWVIGAAEYETVKSRVRDSREDVVRRLAEAKVTVGDGTMTIKADIGGRLTVDISTPGGVNMLQRTVTADGSGVTVITTGALPHGQYVVTLATDLPASAKHLVTVQ